MQVVPSKMITTLQFLSGEISGLVESGLDPDAKKLNGPWDTNKFPDLSRFVKEDRSRCDESATVGRDVRILAGLCGD